MFAFFKKSRGWASSKSRKRVENHVNDLERAVLRLEAAIPEHIPVEERSGEHLGERIAAIARRLETSSHKLSKVYVTIDPKRRRN